MVSKNPQREPGFSLGGLVIAHLVMKPSQSDANLIFTFQNNRHKPVCDQTVGNQTNQRYSLQSRDTRL